MEGSDSADHALENEIEKRKDAVGHLREALETDDVDEKNFHIRQALQHLDVKHEQG